MPPDTSFAPSEPAASSASLPSPSVVGEACDALDDADSLGVAVGAAGVSLTEVLEAGEGMDAGSSGPEQATRVKSKAVAAVNDSGLPSALIEMFIQGS